MPTIPCPHCRAEFDSPTDNRTRQCPHCRESVLVHDRYLLIDVLGSGRAGAVYLGEDEQRNGRKLAVKTLKLSSDVDWQAGKSFMRGANALKRLDHPNLPRVLDADEDGHRVLFLVREIYNGGTLAERVQERGALLEHIPEMLEQLLDVLLLVHRQQPPLLHQDIKPSNIMFRSVEDDRAILLDFDKTGSAQAVRSGIDTAANPVYAPPEYGTVKANAQQDLYSLGQTLLFAATGLEPGDLPVDEDGNMHVAAAAPSLPERVRDVLAGMVALDVDVRFETTAHAIAALTGEWPATADEPEPPPNPLRDGPPPAPPEQRSSLRTAVAVVFVIAIVVAALVALTGRGTLGF